MSSMGMSSHEMSSESTETTQEDLDKYFETYYPEEHAYGMMTSGDMMTSGMMTSDSMTSDTMTSGAVKPTHGYDYGYDFDYDFYHYDDQREDKHDMASGMMSSDTMSSHAMTSDTMSSDTMSSDTMSSGMMSSGMMSSEMMSSDDTMPHDDYHVPYDSEYDAASLFDFGLIHGQAD